MFVRTTSTPNSPRKSVKVVASYREGYKVKQKVIHHLGIAADEEEVQKLKRLGEEFIAREKAQQAAQSPQKCLFDPPTPEEYLEQTKRLKALKEEKAKTVGRKPQVTLHDIAKDDLISLADLEEKSRIIEGIHDVAGHVYDSLGYALLLDRKKDNELLRDIVLMRLANPSSKLKAQAMLAQRFARCHDLDAIYRMMDKLFPRICDLKARTFSATKSLMGDVVDIVFFDCTTLYFESTDTDTLRAFGYSKDHRFNTTQVVLALATNADGLPIGYELFEGNKAEVTTLLACIEQWKKMFTIHQACFVADRAMMSDANLKALEEAGHTYIVAAKLRSLPLALQSQILSPESYAICGFGQEIGWVGEFIYQERRLIVSYKTRRAHHDAEKRSKIMDKIHKTIGNQGDTKKVISNNGVKKYTKITDSTTTLCPEKIAQDEQWDGLHGVITNIPNTPGTTPSQTALQILERYGALWKIEESFRINKNNLSMRPIFHAKPERIKAHIALCYMAFAVLRHMEYKVRLTQKISLETMRDELMNVQASIYVHLPTGRQFRMPGAFTHNAAKIYKAFQLNRKNHAQEIVLQN